MAKKTTKEHEHMVPAHMIPAHMVPAHTVPAHMVHEPVAQKPTATKTPAHKEVAHKETAHKETAPKPVAKHIEKEPHEPRESTDASGKLKVLFCISEAQPFSAAGGLGEVGGSLPKVLAENGIDVRMILPLYQVVGADVRKKFTNLGHMNIKFAYRDEYCGIFEYKNDGVTYYFVDNEKYFKRENIYGYDDDGERFAFLSKAIIDSMALTKFRPDIIHANDWHTAGTIVYLKTSYAEDKNLQKIKTLFTIHNINFQGIYQYNFMTDVMNIDYKYREILDYDGNVNLVKSAIQCADLVNTVSPTYAEEIKTTDLCVGLGACIEANKNKIIGILNGIDYKFYNPKKDKELFENYDAKSLNGKAVNKKGVQKLFQMQTDESIPVILYNGRLAKQKGMDLIKQGIDEILNERIQFIVMGNGEKQYEGFFEYIEDKYRGKFKQMRYSNNLAKKLYAGADIVLMPSLYEPCGLSQMIASRYGAIPIVRETGGLKDTIRDFGCPNGGNGYTFHEYNKDDLVYSVKRAIVDFTKGGKPWTDKIITVIKKDFSWNNTVKDYVTAYKKIKKGK